MALKGDQCVKFLEYTLRDWHGLAWDRKRFWNNLLSKSFMNHDALIIGRDLNLSIGDVESWGPLATPDPLSDFFLNLLDSKGLLNIDLLKIRPTWSNRRIGQQRISKRLDRFLISKNMLNDSSLVRQ